MGSTGPIAVIEAKALGKPLEDKATDQAIIYAHRANIPCMIVSDGDHWRMFASGDHTLMEFQLTRDEPYACALQALGLWRPNLESGKPQEAATPVIIEKLTRDESATNQPGPEPPEPSSAASSSRQTAVNSSESKEQNQDNWIPLTSLKVEKGQKPPADTNIRFPNSSPKPIQNWIDIWVSVATYLIKTDKISKNDCPVRKKQNAKLTFVQTEPIDPKNPKKGKIGNELWLFTNFSATNTYKNACWLLEQFGGDDVSPSTVLVSTNPS